MFTIEIQEANGDRYTMGVSYEFEADAIEDAEFHTRTTTDTAWVRRLAPTDFGRRVDTSPHRVDSDRSSGWVL